MTRRRALLFRLPAVAALALAAATGARANNAFPDEFSVHFPPDNPNGIYVGANFGLISNDGGTEWRYACEPWVVAGSSGAVSNFSVNQYEVTAGGAILADVLTTRLVNRSEDSCNWPTVIPGKQVLDLFASPDDPNFVVASEQAFITVDGGTVTSGFLVASHDGGKTFDSTHLVDADPGDVFSTLEISHSVNGAPPTIYATTSPPTGRPRLFVSTDGGATWPHTYDLPATPNPATDARILAVDPNDPGVVYVRMINGGTTPNFSDAIVKVTGSGAASIDILDLDLPLRGFLLAHDGTLYAGTVKSGVGGQLYIWGKNDTAFRQPIPGPQFRCLAQRPGADPIYACGDFQIDGFSVGVSNDNGKTFTKVMSFRDLAGPLTCPPIASNCASHWQRISAILFGSDAGSVLPDGGTTVPDAGNGNPGGSPSKSGCTSVGAGGSLLMLLLAALAVRKARARCLRTGS